MVYFQFGTLLAQVAQQVYHVTWDNVALVHRNKESDTFELASGTGPILWGHQIGVENGDHLWEAKASQLASLGSDFQPAGD